MYGFIDIGSFPFWRTVLEEPGKYFTNEIVFSSRLERGLTMNSYSLWIIQKKSKTHHHAVGFLLECYGAMKSENSTTAFFSSACCSLPCILTYTAFPVGWLLFYKVIFHPPSRAPGEHVNRFWASASTLRELVLVPRKPLQFAYWWRCGMKWLCSSRAPRHELFKIHFVIGGTHTFLITPINCLGWATTSYLLPEGCLWLKTSGSTV